MCRKCASPAFRANSQQHCFSAGESRRSTASMTDFDRARQCERARAHHWRCDLANSGVRMRPCGAWGYSVSLQGAAYSWAQLCPQRDVSRCVYATYFQRTWGQCGISHQGLQTVMLAHRPGPGMRLLVTRVHLFRMIASDSKSGIYIKSQNTPAEGAAWLFESKQ